VAIRLAVILIELSLPAGGNTKAGKKAEKLIV